MDMMRIVGIGLIGTVLALFLNDYRKEYGLFTSVVTGILILLMVLEDIAPLAQTVSTMLQGANLNNQYFSILLKALGICFVTQMSVDACIDCGNKAVASKIELAGRIAILIVGLPLFVTLLDLVEQLIYL